MKQQFRIRREFLWTPKTIGNDTKWLVTATWQEARHTLNSSSILNPFGIGFEWSIWKPVKFL